MASLLVSGSAVWAPWRAPPSSLISDAAIGSMATVVPHRAIFSCALSFSSGGFYGSHIAGRIPPGLRRLRDLRAPACNAQATSCRRPSSCRPTLPPDLAHTGHSCSAVTGGVRRAQVIEAATDDEAQFLAARIANAFGIDLWERARHLASFPPFGMAGAEG